MFDDDSQSAIQSNSDNWITLEENISKAEIDEFIRTQMPISNQWLKSQWMNWKLFTRPCGFSTTNNNTEGLNRIIKLINTNYERSTILNACKTLEKMLTDLRKSQESFVLKLVRDNGLIKLADFLTLNDFVLTSQTTANRVLNGQIKYSVSVNPKFCTCPYFLEYGICKHFISLCKLLNLQFDENDREFVQVKKRGRPPKSNNGALNKN